MGTQDQFRLLLSQNQPEKLMRHMRYYSYLVAARQEKVADFEKTIKRLDAIAPEIRYQTSKLAAAQSKLQKRKAELTRSISTRSRTIDQLANELSNKGKQLKAMEQDRSHLESVLAKVTRYISDVARDIGKSEFTELKGRLPWPAKGKVLRNFGTQRISNKMQWEGILIGGAEGSPVKAVHHGRVVFSDYLRGHGLLIILDHGSNYLSLYAHNKVLYKELGEWVSVGDTIAALGNSGGLKSSALYFELRHKGKPLNPRNWIGAA